MENASPEDQEFEAARRLVRLAGSAVENAAQMAPSSDPLALARDAMIAAAQAHAPKLLQSREGEHRHHHRGHRPESGHWYRDGNNIVIVGV